MLKGKSAGFRVDLSKKLLNIAPLELKSIFVTSRVEKNNNNGEKKQVIR